MLKEHKFEKTHKWIFFIESFVKISISWMQNPVKIVKGGFFLGGFWAFFATNAPDFKMQLRNLRVL